jgi:hypothetical protein
MPLPGGGPPPGVRLLLRKDRLHWETGGTQGRLVFWVTEC